jgi:hypothetical protein
MHPGSGIQQSLITSGWGTKMLWRTEVAMEKWFEECMATFGEVHDESVFAINSVSNLGGFVRPYAMGAIRTRTGSLYGGLAVVGVSCSYQQRWYWYCEENHAGTYWG